MDCWKDLAFGSGEEVSWGIGAFSLKVRRFQKDCLVWCRQGSGVMNQPRESDPGQWTRYLVNRKVVGVRLLPAFPELPVLYRPLVGVRMPVSLEAHLFIPIPLTVRVQALCEGTTGGQEAITLCDLPTVQLSQTWYGDTMQGELCSSVKAPLCTELDTFEFQPHLAVCPIVYQNRNTSAISLDRSFVHTAHLSLFAGANAFWTSPVTVLDADGLWSDEILYSDKAPAQAGPNARLVLAPREKSERASILRRTVAGAATRFF